MLDAPRSRGSRATRTLCRTFLGGGDPTAGLRGIEFEVGLRPGCAGGPGDPSCCGGCSSSCGVVVGIGGGGGGGCVLDVGISVGG